MTRLARELTPITDMKRGIKLKHKKAVPTGSSSQTLSSGTQWCRHSDSAISRTSINQSDCINDSCIHLPAITRRSKANTCASLPVTHVDATGSHCHVTPSVCQCHRRFTVRKSKKNSCHLHSVTSVYTDELTYLSTRCPPDTVESILERDYSAVLPPIEDTVGLFSHGPFFTRWKITGFTHNKVILSSLGNMTEKQEVTPEFVQYIKERDAALAEVKSAQAELRETQCKLYDALQLLETLQKKSSDSDTKSKGGVGAAVKKTPKKKNAPAAQHEKNGLPVKSGTSATSSGFSSARVSQISHARTDGGLAHPPIPDVDPNADTKDYYWKIAEKFPQLPMFTVLDAESKFLKADVDHRGTIDLEELDRVLSDTVGMFTQKQLTEIMTEIDTNHSDTLDFLEVLTVINKLVSRRKTNLPQSMQQNYSKTCVIQ